MNSIDQTLDDGRIYHTVHIDTDYSYAYAHLRSNDCDALAYNASSAASTFSSESLPSTSKSANKHNRDGGSEDSEVNSFEGWADNTAYEGLGEHTE